MKKISGIICFILLVVIVSKVSSRSVVETPFWTGEAATLRAEPSESSKAVRKLLAGVQLYPDMKRNPVNGWLYVRIPGGDTGWVLKDKMVYAIPELMSGCRSLTRILSEQEMKALMQKNLGVTLLQGQRVRANGEADSYITQTDGAYSIYGNMVSILYTAETTWGENPDTGKREQISRNKIYRTMLLLAVERDGEILFYGQWEDAGGSGTDCFTAE